MGLRDISDEELALYGDALRHIDGFTGAKDLLQIADQNLREFSDTLTKINTTVSEGAGANLPRAEMKLLALDVNRRLVNLLFSFRLYVDYNESRLKRRYGKESDEVSVFRVACSGAFDRCFAYRFLYKLRGYAQHAGLPIDHITSTSQLTDDESTVHTTQIMFDVEELLARGKGHWGRIVEEELRNGPALLDVESLVADLRPELDGIQEELARVERPRLQESARKIIWILGDVLAEGGIPAVGTVESGKAPDALQLLRLPIEEIKSLGVSQAYYPKTRA